MPKGVYERKPKNPVQEAASQQADLNQRLENTSKNEAPRVIKKEQMAYTSRTAALQEIANRSNAEREEFIATRHEHIEGVEPPEDQEETTDQVTQEQLEAQTEESAPEVKKYKGVVDGEEKEFPEDVVIKAGLAQLQKQSSADKRLEEVTRLLEEAKNLNKSQPSGRASSPDVEKPKTDVERPSISAADIAKSILYGNEEEATKAIERIIGQGRQAQELATQRHSYEPQDIVKFVNEAYAFNDAKKMFQLAPEQGGYKDLWEDPQLQAMILNKEQEYRNKGDKRPYHELFKVVGDEVRNWRDGLVKKLAPNTLGNREELKRNSPVVKTASGKTPIPVPKENLPQSREDVLNQLRKARGQPMN